MGLGQDLNVTLPGDTSPSPPKAVLAFFHTELANLADAKERTVAVSLDAFFQEHGCSKAESIRLTAFLRESGLVIRLPMKLGNGPYYWYIVPVDASTLPPEAADMAWERAKTHDRLTVEKRALIRQLEGLGNTPVVTPSDDDKAGDDDEAAAAVASTPAQPTPVAPAPAPVAESAAPIAQAFGPELAERYERAMAALHTRCESQKVMIADYEARLNNASKVNQAEHDALVAERDQLQQANTTLTAQVASLEQQLEQARESIQLMSLGDPKVQGMVGLLEQVEGELGLNPAPTS